MSGFDSKFKFLILRPSYSKTRILVLSSSPTFEPESITIMVPRLSYVL